MSQPSANSHAYVVISPAKNEERFIERTILSMLCQTVLPLKWIVIDDGSSDNTLQIIQNYSRRRDWITALPNNGAARPSVEPELTRREHRASRALAMASAAEIRAFRYGYEAVRKLDFEFLVKLDTDLELPPDYFERMLARFAEDPALGIASGGHAENNGAGWQPVKLPEYHAAGACKIVRRRCFEDIGGFASAAGWDTADEIVAQARGWRTAHFPEIQFRHLRAEGASAGLLRTSVRHGHAYYVCGGGHLFFLAKCAHRALCGKPFLLGGVALFIGYLRALIARSPRLVSAEEGLHYRKLLNRRIVGRVTRMLSLSRT